MTPNRKNRIWSVLFGALSTLIWVAIVAAPHLSGRASFVDRIEAPFLNARFSTFGAIPAPEDVVIVAIDDATLAQGSASGIQGRAQMALIIEKITDQTPKTLAIDILFTDAGVESEDADLAVALSRAPAVIAAAGGFAGQQAESGMPRTRDELWPQTVFADAAQVGMVNIATDVSGTPRHVPLLFLTSQGLVPSLILRSSALFSGMDPKISKGSVQIGDNTVFLDYGVYLPIRLAGPAGTIRTLSAAKILDGSAGDSLRGKLVVLGFTASAIGDRFQTPFDPNTPGVEIIATAISQLLGADGLQRNAGIRQFDVGLAGLIAVLGTVLILALPLASGFPIAVGAVAVGLAITWIAFYFGFWLSAGAVLAAAGPPVGVASIWRYLFERRKAAQADKSIVALKQFQSPVLGELIADDPSFLLKPEAQNLIIFFIDLSGFTNLSQDMGPSQTEDFLKRFHTAINEEVQQRNGIVFNYMGDGALAVFGIIDSHIDPAGDALETAFVLVDQVRKLGHVQGLAAPLGCRIGLHAGVAILSRLGHARHQQVSVTGDSVNLASRLMEIAKAEGATIAATTEFLDQTLSEPAYPVDFRKGVAVRGRSGMVEVCFWTR